MKNFLTIAALGSVIAFGAQAQDVKKLITEDYVSHVIGTLASDDMQGRGDFQPGLEKAARFIEGEFKKDGLQPMPGKSSYRQPFALVKRAPVSLQVNINGDAVAADKAFAIADSSFTLSVNDAAVLHISAGQNFNTEYQKVIQSDKKTLVIVDPSFDATFKRIVNRTNRAVLPGKAHPQVVFVEGQYDNVTTLSAIYEGHLDRVMLNNIVGVLPGKSKPNEYVVFSGHYDHLGIVKPVKGDSIANGADDDASGTTAVIALARYFSKMHNNERTIIFAAFAAEELGELGSTYFATQVDPNTVIAGFNIEMIGKPSRFGEHSVYITGYQYSDFGKILQKNIPDSSFKFYPDPYTTQNLFYRSDNASLAKVGVPAHTISTDQIDIDQYYHQVTDELSTLNVANITDIIRGIALASRSIISGADTPTRVPPLQR